jgi:hypothetical protein
MNDGEFDPVVITTEIPKSRVSLRRSNRNLQPSSIGIIGSRKSASAALEAVLDEHPSLGGSAITAVETEIDVAGRALGFDVYREDWIDLVNQKPAAYNLPVDKKDQDRNLAPMPNHIRGPRQNPRTDLGSDRHARSVAQLGLVPSWPAQPLSRTRRSIPQHRARFPSRCQRPRRLAESRDR